jgi:hypothetical protein
MLWDVFISHAHEDKAEIASPLARGLAERGLRVWIDETELMLGDSLRSKIDEGLAASKFGVVILSEDFFAKRWPQSELSALWARENEGGKVLLPVWHGMTRDRVASFSPLLADRLAISTDQGIDRVVGEVLKVAGGSRELSEQQLRERYSEKFDFSLSLVTEARSAITELTARETWASLALENDMSRDNVWMGNASVVLVSVFYRLYTPVALFRQVSYALERSLATFTREDKIRFCLLESAFYALTNEVQLAASGSPLAYSPRVSQWRQRRKELPQRYWWQGISDERFDEAINIFIQKTSNSGQPVVADFESFRQSYVSAYRSCGENQQVLGVLANPLYGFNPKDRPVYWRLLVFWWRVYSLYERVVEDAVENIDDLKKHFNSQRPSEPGIANVSREDLFESAEITWLATSEFWDTFVLPRLRTCFLTCAE